MHIIHNLVAFGAADPQVRRREDCVKLVSTLERAQRIMDELRAMPIEGALFDSAF